MTMKLTTGKLVAGAVALSFLGAAPAAAQEQVKIAVLEDMQSSYSDITGRGSVAAAELAIADFGGKALGRDIVLLSADHQNKADVASNIARRWYDEEKVTLITGLGNTAAAVAVRALARDRGAVDIVASAASTLLDNAECSPTGFHWSYNTYSNAKVVAKAVTETGARDWYFLTTDYAFGHSIQSDMTRFIEEAGGKVLGSVSMPLGTLDFSSFLLQAQAAGPEVISIAAGGADFVNALKQANEFGLHQTVKGISGTVVFVQDVRSITPETAQGLYLAESFYWDLDDETRAFSERFEEKVGLKPNTIHAGNYSAVLHYLKAVEAAGTTEPEAVAAKMRELPVEDFYTKGATVRPDGVVERDLHLFQVKSPDQVKGEWDLYNLISTVPGPEAYWPLSESTCPYLKQ